MCVSGYTLRRQRVNQSRREPHRARRAHRIVLDQHRNPDRRAPRRSATGAPSPRPFARRIDGLNVDVGGTQPAGDVARAERSPGGAGEHRARAPARSSRSRSGPSPRITTSSGSSGDPARCRAAARAQQAIVSLDRNQPADREHRRAASGRAGGGSAASGPVAAARTVAGGGTTARRRRRRGARPPAPRTARGARALTKRRSMPA